LAQSVKKQKTPKDPEKAWFVWWRERTILGLGAYSEMHRTVDNAKTLRKKDIRDAEHSGADITHVGIRVAKREPRRHALKVCGRCLRKAGGRKKEGNQQAA
jgi:hypothetical protein